jgi:hypothetical protein
MTGMFQSSRTASGSARLQPQVPLMVGQAKNIIEYLGVVRFLLEPHQLIVDGIQALAGLRQKLPQKIVHQNTPSKALDLRSTVNHFSHWRSVVCQSRSRQILWPEVTVPPTQLATNDVGYVA